MNKNQEKKKKHGFTLIELLAVIVILAVIALIVTPIVTNIISSSKESADKRSAEGYVKAAENYYADSTLNEEKKSTLGTNVIDKLTVSGNQASGSIIINDKGQVEMAIVINNKCYKKNKDSNEIAVDTKDNCNIVTAVIPPDRCFMTQPKGADVSIYSYTCGDSYNSNGASDTFSNMFNSDGEFTNIELPSTIGGKKVVEIFQDVFSAYSDGYGGYKSGRKVGVKSVIVPEGVTVIQTNAFGSNELESITLPNSLTEIYGIIFNEALKLKTIKIDKANGSISDSPWGAPSTTTITWLR